MLGEWNGKEISRWKCISHSVMSDSSDFMDYSLPGSSVHGILQARILEWVATLFSRNFPHPGIEPAISCIAGRFFTVWAIWEVQVKWLKWNNMVPYIDTYVHVIIDTKWFTAVQTSGTVTETFAYWLK